MVGDKAVRRLDRTDWELLIRQYEAGASIADIMALTGLSDGWVRNRLRTHSQDDPANRARHHLEALRRELIRAETELLKGGVDTAVKRMRALNMLVKLEKELKQAAVPADMPAAEAEDIEDVRAELERRFNRLREVREAKGFYCEPEPDSGAGALS